MRIQGLVVVALCGACGNNITTNGYDLSMIVDAAGSVDGGSGDGSTTGDGSVVLDGAGLVDGTAVVDGGGALDGAVSPINRYLSLVNSEQITITIDHGTSPSMRVDDITRSFSVSGTLVSLASGFYKVTVSAGCDGLGCTPSSGGSTQVPNGVVVHGVEARGYFVLLQPDTGSGGPVVGVAENSCPPGMFATYNVVNVGLAASTDLTTNGAYAVATLGGTSAAVTVAGVNHRIDDSSGGTFSAPSPSACTSGSTTFSGTTVQTSGNGLVFVVPQQGSGGIGFAQSNVTLADVENHSYSGYLIQNTSSGGQDGGGGGTIVSLPVGATFGNGPIGTGAPFTDVDNNVQSTTMAGTVTLGTVSNGLVSGTLTTGNGVGKFRAAAWKDGSRTYLFFIAADMTNTSPFNLILVSR